MSEPESPSAGSEQAPSTVDASLRVVVRGRVQGVGFRDFVYTRARFLGLRGYVRNLPDMRSVEVVAEGERASLEQMLDFLREGPRGARIDGLDAIWGEPGGRHTTFGVAH
jgi:acylphosphatase